MNTELQVLAESLIEFVEVVLVLSDLTEEVHALLDNVLSDDLEDLVLLQRLTRDVEGEVLRVNDTLDKVEILWDEVLTVVHDEDTTDIELDVVALLLGLKEIERCSDPKILYWIKTTSKAKHSPLRDEEDGLELELALNGEVLDGEMVLPVVGQTLVEGGILLRLDILRIAGPNRLRLVQLLVCRLLLLDLLGLLFLGLVVLIFNFFDLGLVLVILDLCLLFLLNILRRRVSAYKIWKNRFI